MTVGELQELLKDKDPSMRVFVNGWEGGADDPVLSEIKVWEHMGGSYNGTHRIVEDWHAVDEDYANVTPVKGVLLRRY